MTLTPRRVCVTMLVLPLGRVDCPSFPPQPLPFSWLPNLSSAITQQRAPWETVSRASVLSVPHALGKSLPLTAHLHHGGSILCV